MAAADEQEEEEQVAPAEQHKFDYDFCFF